MSNDLLNFRWPVHREGYEIAEVPNTVTLTGDDKYRFRTYGEDESTLQTVIRSINPESDITLYNPTDNIALFNEFATLSERVNDNDYNAILDFVNSYGFLYEHVNFPDFNKTTTENYESVEYWRQESHDMALAINLWQAIKDHNKEIISHHVKKQGEKWYLNHESRRELISASISSCVPRASWDKKYEYYYVLQSSYGSTSPRNAFEAAYHFLCHFCNLRTNKSLTTISTMDKYNQHLEINIFPNCLESSIWFSLQQAISRDLKFKQCEECTTFFKCDTKKRRYEKRFCSGRCQKRNERKRKQK